MIRQDTAKVMFAKNGHFGTGFGANMRQELPSSQQHLNGQGLPSHSQQGVTNGCDGVPIPGAAQASRGAVEESSCVAERPPPAHSTHLCLVHADQALVDLGPGGHSTDVPELVGVLGKRACLHLKETQAQG